MAKVAPVASAKSFLDSLEKSGLVAAEDLRDLRKTQDEAGDPKGIARDLIREGKLTKWQAGQLLHGFHLLTVGKYKLLDQIGAGQMGRVYLAEHAQLGRRSSLKVLSKRYTTQPGVREKFLEEAQRVSALNHRNLSHVFDVNADEDRLYLVMEFVEGKDLQRLVESAGATTPAQACDVVRQAAEGLMHAHENSVFHGDLKPSNLLIDSQGVVKILDLGLGSLTQGVVAASGEESTEMASPSVQSFQAPEKRSGKQQPNVLGDIYSLGGILYFLLTGKAPLGDQAIADAIVEVSPTASDELVELCSQMLAEDPSHRPQSAKEVIAGIEAALRSKPVPLPKPTAKKGTAAAEGKKSGANPKAKKPLVAKALVAQAPPLPLPGSPEEIVEGISLDGITLEEEATLAPSPGSTESSAVAEPASAAEDDPFGGFSLQTKGKRPAKKPDSAPSAAVAKAVATSGPDKNAASDSPTPAAKTGKSSRLPLIIGGAVGGVLVFSILVVILVMVLTGGGDDTTKPETLVAQGKGKEGSPAEKAPVEANPEADPEANPESTPLPAATPTPTPKPEVPGPTTPMPTVPMPMPTDPPPTTPTPMPPVPEPMPPVPVPTPEPPPTTPMPEAVPVGNPFEGFAVNTTLPPIEANNKPVATPPPAAILGTIKLPPKALCSIQLKGGENAFKGKAKFTLEAAENGTALRDWEIKLSPDGVAAPEIIAKLNLKDDQFSFEWTADSLKFPAAPYLCNCLLAMSAGTGSHQLALRAPIVGNPLTVEFEKSSMNTKWTIDYPPNPKQIVLKIGPVEGAFPKYKVGPKEEISAAKDTTEVAVGNGEEALILIFKLDSSMVGKQITVISKPQFKLEGMSTAQPLLKNVLKNMVPSAVKTLEAARQQQQLLITNPTIPPEQKAQAELIANKKISEYEAQHAQAVQLQQIVEGLQGKGKIHFQVHYEADDAKVPLISTATPPEVMK